MTWLGRADYATTVARMQAHRRALVAGDSSAACLLLCEHEPVITCGKRADQDNILLSDAERQQRGISLVESERGGDVTYHGPGQLMVYPVVRVGVKVSRFLEALARGLALVAESYGVHGARWRREEAGLWVGTRKLAACGLHISRGVSIHGYALNVSTPPESWSCIVPCGLTGPGPVSLAELTKQTAPTVEEVALVALPILSEVLEDYGLQVAQAQAIGINSGLA